MDLRDSRVYSLRRAPSAKLKEVKMQTRTKKELKQHIPEINLLLDSTLVLQQARLIAQNSKDTELLYLLDMIAIQIVESINRHISDHEINKLLLPN
jgi:hypothetical protein